MPVRVIGGVKEARKNTTKNSCSAGCTRFAQTNCSVLKREKIPWGMSAEYEFRAFSCQYQRTQGNVRFQILKAMCLGHQCKMMDVLKENGPALMLTNDYSLHLNC